MSVQEIVAPPQIVYPPPEEPKNYWLSVKQRLGYVADWCVSWFDWTVIHLKVILFNLAVLPILALVYWTVNSVGLRMSVPVLATKLYKIPIPGFSRMIGR